MDFSKLRWKSEDSCFEAVVDRQNIFDARLLQRDYAGEKSETTAVLTYSYQSYVFSKLQPELAKIIEKIAIQEMLHHETLGRLIVELGGNPIIGNNRRFWSGGYVGYATRIREALSNNINAERTAIFGYKQTLAQLQTKSIKPVIESIIADEMVHIETFGILLKHYYEG